MTSHFTASEVASGRLEVAAAAGDTVEVAMALDHLLDHCSDSFFRVKGLCALKRHLKTGGVFGPWSDVGTDRRFLDRLGAAFTEVRAESVVLDNPRSDRPFTPTVFLARAEGE